MRELTLVLLTLLLVGESMPVQVPAAARWPQFRGPNGSGVADADAPPIQFGSSVRLVWKVDLPPGHSSPIVWDDHIFLTAVENEKLMVMALRRRDGVLRWKQIVPGEAIEKVHPFSSAASSTPATDGERVYVYVGSFGLLAYDFDGKEMWRRPLTLPPTKYGTATSPIVFGGKVIVQRDGNSTNSKILAVDARTGADAWRAPRPTLQESWSTPMLWSHGGTVELVTVGNGRVVAYSPNDGVERWQQRLGVLGQYCASPVAAAGRIYAASETGTVVVFRAGDTLEVLARSELGESIVATPAIAGNKLYVRTSRHLWAFGE